MEQNRKAEITVGIVSVVGILLLIVGILLGKGTTLHTSTHTFTVRLPSSGGIEPSSPVVVNGVKRGRVTDIRSDHGSVLLTAELDRFDDIHADAHALVSILEITGGKKLELFPGTSPKPFDRTKEIPGRTAADIGGLVTLVGDVSGELVTLLRRLDTISAVVTHLMADGTIAENVKSMTSDGAVLVRDARIWMEENRTDLTISVRDMKGALADVRNALKDNEPKMSSALDKLNQRLTEAEAVLAKTDRAIVGIDSLVSSVQSVVTDIRTNDGLLHAILYDPTFKRQMDTLSVRLRRFVDQARINGVNVNVGIGHK